MLYERVNKALNWGIRLASLAVTGPATWMATDLEGVLLQLPVHRVKEYAHV